MKKLAKVLGIIALGLVVLASGTLGFLYLRKPAMRPAADIKIQVTPERLARGKYVFNLADCDGCHTPRDFSRFDGPAIEGRRGAGNVFPPAMGLPGVVAPPNITPDVQTGIGSWTDGEKIRAIREGVDRDGRALFPMMPYQNFRHMSDEDVYSLVAYLDSLPAVRSAIPKTKLNLPVSLLIKGKPQPVLKAVPPPDSSTQVKYGEYLVTMAGCMDCHTPTLGGGEKFTVAPGVAVVSANISPDPHTGTGSWKDNDFVNRFYQYREYVEKGSPQVGPESFTLMPWLNLCHLPEDDLKAIYAFIRTRQPIYKAVDTHPNWNPGGAPATESASVKQAVRRFD
jgi:mono/diheme cytochrome c family protein